MSVKGGRRRQAIAACRLSATAWLKSSPAPSKPRLETAATSLVEA